MTDLSSPPGLASSDVETTTVSRERRRVTLAAKSAVEQLTSSLAARLLSLEEKLDRLLAGFPEVGEARLAQFCGRISRLESLIAVSPSVDDVLDGLLERKKHEETRKCAEFDISSEHGDVNENDEINLSEVLFPLDVSNLASDLIIGACVRTTANTSDVDWGILNLLGSSPMTRKMRRRFGEKDEDARDENMPKFEKDKFEAEAYPETVVIGKKGKFEVEGTKEATVKLASLDEMLRNIPPFPREQTVPRNANQKLANQKPDQKLANQKLTEQEPDQKFTEQEPDQKLADPELADPDQMLTDQEPDQKLVDQEPDQKHTDQELADQETDQHADQKHDDQAPDQKLASQNLAGQELGQRLADQELADQVLANQRLVDQKPADQTFAEKVGAEDCKPVSLEDFKALLDRSTDELVDHIKKDFSPFWSEQSLQQA